MDRFTSRGASVVAASVDPPSHSRSMIRRMKLEFPIVSDEDQQVQLAYGVQNPATQELALHAVFIVNEQRKIIYRKIASRRPKSQELLDAIDYYNGTYPMGDKSMIYEGIPVAFPRNNFQALIEVATNTRLPDSIDLAELEPVMRLLGKGQSDDATILYRQVMAGLSADYGEAELSAVAAWFARRAVDLPDEAMLVGNALNQALVQQRQMATHPNPDQAQLDALVKDLDRLRSVIRNNAERWKLSSLKSTLRSYRELSLASLRS